MVSQSRFSSVACMYVVLLLMLSACSSSSSDNPDELFSKVAFVNVTDHSAGPVVLSPYLAVRTGEVAEPRTVGQMKRQAIESYSRLSGQCGEVDWLEGYYVELENPDYLGEVVKLHAGEVITVQSNGNSIADIGAELFGLYSWDEGVEGVQLPDDLVMNIPGHDFPAVTDLALPAVSDLSVVQRLNYAAGDTLTWEGDAGNNLPAVIAFNDSEFCVTEDDGEFTIAETINPITSVSIIRRHVTVTSQNGALLVVLRARIWAHWLDER